MNLALCSLVFLLGIVCLMEAALNDDTVDKTTGSNVAMVAENLRGTWKPRNRVHGWGADKHASALRIREDDRSSPARLRSSWKAWRKRHARRVFRNSSDEELHARVFEESEAMVAENKIAYATGLASYELAINEFADYTEEEFAQLGIGQVGLKATMESQSNVIDSRAFEETHGRSKRSPMSVDWRKAGKVGPVKNQGACGSSYAFSAVGAIESRIAIKYNISVSLSEQQVVDRAGWGCSGSTPWNVFMYVKKNTTGLPNAQQYPYTSRVCSPCPALPPPVTQSKLAGHVMIPKGDEKALQDAVANTGPVSIMMNFGNQGISLYKSGVYNNYVGCPNTPTQPVLIVGYGTENGMDYFTIRNSWGETWGDHGYIKFRRGVNICGIADWASYPTLA